MSKTAQIVRVEGQPPRFPKRPSAGEASDASTRRAAGRDASFETIFRTLPDIVVVIDDASGAVREINNAVRALLGYEPATLIGKPFGDALQLASAGSVETLLVLTRMHAAAVVEWDVKRIDGSSCPMHVSATLSSWGERAAIVATLRDITLRKRAEAALIAAEQKYRSIYANTVEGIFQTTADGRYLSANPSLAAIYGYESPQILIQSLTDIAGRLYVDPARRGEFRRRLEADDSVREFESQVYRADGSIIWISENARAVRDAGGRLLYYEGTVIDISRRKRAEEAQRREAAVAAALARVGEELIAVFDVPRILQQLCKLLVELLESDSSRAFLWDPKERAYIQVCGAGDGASRLVGESVRFLPTTAPELLARLERDGVALLDAAACRSLPTALVPAGTNCEASILLVVQRGGVPAGLLMAAYRAEPQPFGAHHERIARGMMHLAALGLEHADLVEALARANRLKSEFVATMSHELRTPLNIILGYGELLLEDVFGPLTAEQREPLQRIGDSGRDLLELIEATLDLNRLDAGRLAVMPRPVVVAELATSLAQELAPLTEKPGVRVVWDVASDLPEIVSDAAKLRVVLKNLISNAIKFTDTGMVRIAARHRATGVEFAVSDTGIGIAPTALPVIFEAFRQGDGSMTRRHGGIGLGLHLVQRLLDVLGGNIEVESVEGVGSTFSFWLTVTPA